MYIIPNMQTLVSSINYGADDAPAHGNVDGMLVIHQQLSHMVTFLHNTSHS